MSSEYRHLRYWAKTYPNRSPDYHPVLYHCLDVAAVGRTLLELRPAWLERLSRISRLELRALLNLAPFLLSLHDLGKMAMGFQFLAAELMERLQGAAKFAPYNADLWKHDTVGYVAVSDRLRRDGLGGLIRAKSEAAAKGFRRSWLSAAMGHHGVPPTIDPDQHDAGMPIQFPPFVAADFDRAITQLGSLLLPSGFDIPSHPEALSRLRASSWLFAGLAVTSDWIGSSQDWFEPTTTPHSAESYFHSVALPAAENAMAAAGLLEKTIAKRKSFSDLWPGFSPTPLQQLADRLPLQGEPQLVVVEEVTGGGKTEAAFTLAHRLMAADQANGLYIGLPTMATANAMYDRIERAYRMLFDDSSEPSIVLAHGRSKMRLALESAGNPDSTIEGAPTAAAQCSDWLADNRKKALLAEVGIGTVDQALLGVLQARHQSLRLWGLAGKVLVVDEVHAADAYMQRLLEGLLEAHATFGGSAILLSATLSSDQRHRLLRSFAAGAGYEEPAEGGASYPALVHLNSSHLAVYPLEARREASRTLEVELLDHPEDADRRILDTLDRGGCACWIRNTVADAIEAWDLWSKRLGSERVLLFHARFAAADRDAIEKKVIHRFGKRSGPGQRCKMLLISTQVVEQSLDLCFDTMISDLAPIDLLVQRAGRLHRHRRSPDGQLVDGADQRGMPRLSVVAPQPVDDCSKSWFSDAFPRAAFVYRDHGRLWLGARWLADRGNLRIPEDLRELIEQVYGADAVDLVPEALQDSTIGAEGSTSADRSIGAANRIEFVSGYAPSKLYSAWRPDVATPTRLGEETTTVRLARVVGDRLEPWVAEGPYRWQQSELTVRASLISTEAASDAEMIEDAKRRMRDRGRYCVVLPLRADEAGQLRGRANIGPGQTVELTYSADRGLDRWSD